LTIKPIQKQNVVNEVYDQISGKLLDVRWAPGSRLPSEAELTTSFNVCRVSVRSAVQRFRDLGIVVTRQGSGSYVSENFIPQMLSNDPRSIMHLSREEFHDISMFCDSLIVMQNGQIVATGTPQAILSEELLWDVFRVKTKIEISPIHGKKHIHFII
jgi:DNA-binding GntR family transcriptional regulator